MFETWLLVVLTANQFFAVHTNLALMKDDEQLTPPKDHKDQIDANNAINGKINDYVFRANTPPVDSGDRGKHDEKVNQQAPPETSITDETAGSTTAVSDDHVYGNQALLGRPIRVDELASYVDEMSKRKDGFRDEFVVRPFIV